MLKFLGAAAFAAAIFMGLPFAAAQDFMGNPTDSKSIRQASGTFVNVTGTSTAIFDFGFKSRLVKICIDDGSGRIFMRLWNHSGPVTDTATSAATFRSGVAGTQHAGGALSMQGTDSGDAHPFCETWPFAVTGLIFGYAIGPAAATATVDVWAVPE